MINKQSLIFKISKDEMIQFSLLLDQGLDTKTIVELCFKQSDKIIDQLNQGKVLTDILTKNQNQKYFKLLNSLSKKMPFSKSIECASQIEESVSSLSKDLVSKSIYPIFIFLFAYFMILFFSNSIVPSMSSFSNNEMSFFILDFLKIFYSFVFFCMIISIVIFAIFYFNKTFNHRFIKFLDRYSIIKRYKTIQFSVILSFLLKSGIHTRECLEVISNMNLYSSIHEYALQMLQALNKGQTIEQTIKQIPLDDTFKTFFNIGLKTGNLENVLLLYKKQATYRFSQTIKHLTNAIQVFSYVSVGMLVLVVYQVMLVPLNMLNGM